MLFLCYETSLSNFRHRPELLDDTEVSELIREYDQVCDQFIELEQQQEASKEDLLKILVREI
ncbi:hypothetical protein GCM10009117_14730 [Gangjinia marincola]|uniref:Uncharacterized protein n=1 Tax=Gangjinia marincola TaxID=578463 RepID=A0ABP3XSE1_9FLAO